MFYGFIRFIIMVVLGTLIAFAFALGVGFIVAAPSVLKWIAYPIFVIIWFIYKMSQQQKERKMEMKVKILIESDGKNNDMTVLQPSRGLKAQDILPVLGGPLMNILLTVCENEDEAISLLTAMLRGYEEANDVDLNKGGNEND